MAKIKGTQAADVIGPDAVSDGVAGGPATGCADLICGKGGDDHIAGGGGDDCLRGGKGDDTLRGEAGDDRLDGGCGVDEAVYAGPRSNYEVAVAADGTITVRDLNGAADGLDEGTDTLCSIERLRFLDSGSTGVTRVSVSSSGEQANADIVELALSADGRVVGFQSEASNLVPDDTNGIPGAFIYDIFVRNLDTGVTTRVNTSASGEEANARSDFVSLSADGRFVAFSSLASNLVPGDTNGVSDVFVKDLATGAITLVSTSASGEQGDADSDFPSLSADGTILAFQSLAENLLPDIANDTRNVFVKNLVTGAITLATTSASGEQANSASESPALSADGRVVAFDSFATNLVPEDTNGERDVFVKDLTTGAITRASTSASGAQANGGSFQDALSADGRVVAFTSFADNLVPGDTNGAFEVFVKDLTTGAVTRTDISASGEQGNAETGGASLSRDGSIVAFTSASSNLVPGDTNQTLDVFVRDLITGEVTLVSASASGGSGNRGSFGSPLSADGSVVAFVSLATDLVPGDTNGFQQAFVRDLKLGTGTGTGEEVYALAPDGALTLLPGTAPHPLADTSPIG